MSSTFVLEIEKTNGKSNKKKKCSLLSYTLCYYAKLIGKKTKKKKMLAVIWKYFISQCSLAVITLENKFLLKWKKKVFT